MGEHGAICRLGVFYDGTFFAIAQNYYYHERQPDQRVGIAKGEFLSQSLA